MTVGRFSAALLKSLEDAHFFDSLNSLPPVNYSPNQDTPVSEHPFVVIESQATLFRIKKTLEDLSTSDEELSEAAIAPLQNEILNKRFISRLNFPWSQAYFYGAPITLKANAACIFIAKNLFNNVPDHSNTYPTFVHRLIPGLVGNLEADFSFSFEKNELTSAVDHLVFTDGVRTVVSGALSDHPTFKERVDAIPTTLTQQGEKGLYDVLYKGLIDIPSLILRLHAFIPKNTWKLYLQHYDTQDLITLMLEKIMAGGTQLNDTQCNQAAEMARTLLKAPEKHQTELLQHFGRIWKQLSTKASQNNNDDTDDVVLEKNSDHYFNRVILCVAITLYTRIRALLPEYLSNTGFATGTSKTVKLKEANALIEFLLSDHPLETLDDWLGKTYPVIKASLSTSYAGAMIGLFVNLNGNLDDIYAKIKEVAPEPAPAPAATKPSRWLWG